MNPDDDTTESKQPLAALAWQRWPEGLRMRGYEVLTQVQSGRPQDALAVIDELMTDLLARRESLAESANRRYEPSTDDRNR